MAALLAAQVVVEPTTTLVYLTVELAQSVKETKAVTGGLKPEFTQLEAEAVQELLAVTVTALEVRALLAALV
jgi:hypothetical protein